MDLRSTLQSYRCLKEFSTFGIGGPARLFTEVVTIEEMQEVLAYAYAQQLPFFILGKGSNCLFDDRGFDGLVILNKITHMVMKDREVQVGAGYSFSMLGVKTAKLGLSGLEFACGIPATVGGAVFMNAGANGEETSKNLTEVSFIDEQGRLHALARENLEFSYRFSSFQKKKGAIVEAKFLLTPSLDARQKQLSIIKYRTQTQPYDEKSIGCFFKNPSQMSAGALIEKSGLKGFSCGGAEVSKKHANFIINAKDAKTEDVLSLVKYVQEKVQKETGIELELEVRCIPYQI